MNTNKFLILALVGGIYTKSVQPGDSKVCTRARQELIRHFDHTNGLHRARLGGANLQTLVNASVPDLLNDRLKAKHLCYQLKCKYTKKVMDEALEQAWREVQKMKRPRDCELPSLPSVKPIIRGAEELIAVAEAYNFDSVEYSRRFKFQQEKYVEVAKDKVEGYIKELNEVLRIAKEVGVYGSDEIEDAHAALGRVADAFGLLEEQVLGDIEFASKRLVHDRGQTIYATIRYIRISYLNSEFPGREAYLADITKLRGLLTKLYRECTAEYEMVRSEIYYLLRRIRRDAGWVETDLDWAIEKAKHLATQVYTVPVKDWRNLLPEIPQTSIRGMRLHFRDTPIANYGDDATHSEDPYAQGRRRNHSLQVDMLRMWISMCEILETFHEESPDAKTEELYGLMFGLLNHMLFFECRHFHFIPWFEPIKYRHARRVLHVRMHYMRAAIYEPLAIVYSYDVLQACSRQCEREERKTRMSVFDQAILESWPRSWQGGVPDSNPEIAYPYFLLKDADSKAWAGLHYSLPKHLKSNTFKHFPLLEVLHQDLGDIFTFLCAPLADEEEAANKIAAAVIECLPHARYRERVARGYFLEYPGYSPNLGLEPMPYE